MAAGLVWTIGQGGMIYGLDPATGKVRQQVAMGIPANHFPTPSVGDGLLLAACAENVVAFAGSGHGRRTSTSTITPARRSTCQSYSPPGNGIPHRIIAAIGAISVGVLAVIIGLGWIFWRRRASRVA